MRHPFTCPLCHAKTEIVDCDGDAPFVAMHYVASTSVAGFSLGEPFPSGTISTGGVMLWRVRCPVTHARCERAE